MTILKKVTNLRYLRRSLKFSKPSSSYRRSREVPLIVPVIAKDALYLTDSIFLEKDALYAADHILHHNSQDEA